MNIDIENVKWAIWQKEKGISGTIHLQGFVCLKIKKRFNFIKKLFGNKFHIELGRNMIACIKYVTKKDTRIEGPWSICEVPNISNKYNKYKSLNSNDEMEYIDYLINQNLTFTQIYRLNPEVAGKHIIYIKELIKEIDGLRNIDQKLKVFFLVNQALQVNH